MNNWRMSKSAAVLHTFCMLRPNGWCNAIFLRSSETDTAYFLVYSVNTSGMKKKESASANRKWKMLQLRQISQERWHRSIRNESQNLKWTRNWERWPDNGVAYKCTMMNDHLPRPMTTNQFCNHNNCIVYSYVLSSVISRLGHSARIKWRRCARALSSRGLNLSLVRFCLSNPNREYEFRSFIWRMMIAHTSIQFMVLKKKLNGHRAINRSKWDHMWHLVWFATARRSDWYERARAVSNCIAVAVNLNYTRISIEFIIYSCDPFPSNWMRKNWSFQLLMLHLWIDICPIGCACLDTVDRKRFVIMGFDCFAAADEGVYANSLHCLWHTAMNHNK